MANLYRMKQKVRIVSNVKFNGDTNVGRIIGIEYEQAHYYLSAVTEENFYKYFDKVTYKIAYVDCFTKRCCVEWHYEKELSKVK